MKSDSANPDSQGNHLLYILILLVLSGLFYLWGIGRMALWDTDEALYTQIAREMASSGDYLTTRWNGQPWFCHPPLYFWMTALTGSLFNWSPLGARLPSAVFGMLFILSVYWLGALMFNRRTGLYGGLIILSALQVWLQCRMAILDMPFLFFITVAVCFLYRGFKEEKPFWNNLGFWISCGFAVLAKGPVGVLLPLLYGISLLIINRRWDLLPGLIFHPGIFVFALISVPWYLGMIQVYGQPFISQVFGYFFVDRVFKPVMNQGGEWYYYFPYLLAGFLPWTSFLPLTFYGMIKELKDRRILILLLWITGTFILFSVSGTKRPNYMLFLYPWLSISMGFIMERILHGGLYLKAFKWSFVFFSLSAVIVISAFGIAAGQFYPQYWARYGANLTPLGWALILGGVVTLILTYMKKELAFYNVLAMMALTYMMLISYIPLVESIRPEPRISARVREMMAPGERFAMRGNFGRQFSILYYVNAPVYFFHSDEDLTKALNSGRFTYYVVEHGKNLEKLKPDISSPLQVIMEDGGLVLFRTSGEKRENLRKVP